MGMAQLDDGRKFGFLAFTANEGLDTGNPAFAHRFAGRQKHEFLADFGECASDLLDKEIFSVAAALSGNPD